MNKLGFYIENSTIPSLRDALQQVKPPTVLIHAGDRGLLRDIRSRLTPDSFVIGRLFVDLKQQVNWLDDPDPGGRGRAYADTILNYDFGMATERGANDRLLIDAWMGLNEVLPGPASFPNQQVSAEYKRRAAALDAFQVAFRERLRSQNLEAVAFNFGAGNYTTAAHYLDWFPGTLESYKYLGFHEYGWPTLMPDASRGTQSAALIYRQCLAGIRERYGNRHQVVITEAGLARMYKYPNDPAGDVGWLYGGETLAEDDYWQSLDWYNTQMNQDDYVLGACLFQVGHAGRWETFRHLGTDNRQRPITLMAKIASLNVPVEPPPPPPPPPPEEDVEAIRQQIAQLIATLEPWDQLTNDYPPQVARTRNKLEAVAPAATQATNLLQELDALMGRLDQQVAELDRLQAEGTGNAAAIAALRGRIATLRSQIDGLKPAAQQAAGLSGAVAEAQQQVPPHISGAAKARQLRPQVDEMLAEARRLESEVGAAQGLAPQPAMVDLRPVAGETGAPEGALAVFPAAPGFPLRPVEDVRRIVVHHTMTRSDVTPQRLAEMHRGQGLPGIRYHFLINGDGTATWTQPLTALLPQTGVDQVNVDGVAVALAGNFSQHVPSSVQLESAAEVVAWLLAELRLPPEAMVGRSEVDPGVISPGAQWTQGVCFKDILLDGVNAILATGR